VTLETLIAEHFPDVLRLDNREDEKWKRIERQQYADSSLVPTLMEEQSLFYFVETPTPLQLQLTMTYTPAVPNAKPKTIEQLFILRPHTKAADTTHALWTWTIDEAQASTRR